MFLSCPNGNQDWDKEGTKEPELLPREKMRKRSDKRDSLLGEQRPRGIEEQEGQPLPHPGGRGSGSLNARADKQVVPAVPKLGIGGGTCDGSRLKGSPEKSPFVVYYTPIFGLKTPGATRPDDTDLVRHHKNNCSSGFVWGCSDWK